MTSVVKSVNNSNVSKVELERLCINVVDYEKLSERHNNLKGQLLSFGSLFRTQLEKLKSQGVKFENESTLDNLLRAENIQTTIANGVVNLIETRDKVI